MNRSSLPRKTRNQQIYYAAMQTASKQLSCALSKDLRKKYGKRSARIKEGDTASIIRGEFAGVDGKVTKTLDFGAFVEFAPGREGLVHISHLDWKRVDKVGDVVSVGDKVKVKLFEIDKQGRLNFSMKLLKDKPK